MYTENKPTGPLSWQTEYTILMQFLALSTIPVSSLAYALNLETPTLRIFISSLFPNIQSYSIWLRLILGIPTPVILMATWASCVVIGVIFYLDLYIFLFLLIEMRLISIITPILIGSNY